MEWEEVEKRDRRMIGKKLEEYRKERGLTRHQMAIKLGVSYNSYLNWTCRVNPTYEPKAKTLYLIAKKLGVTMESFFE